MVHLTLLLLIHGNECRHVVGISWFDLYFLLASDVAHGFTCSLSIWITSGAK